MPLLKPSFNIPGQIPYISGNYGPFINVNLTPMQKRGVYSLIFVTIIIIIIFTAGAYYYQFNENTYYSRTGNYCKDQNQNKDDSLNNFLNAGVDTSAFFLGMTAGIIFGLIDNMGLWYGLDALDPVFDSSKVPWIYGNGGKRYFSGIDSDGKLVYENITFKDGKLSDIEIKKFKNIANNIEKSYIKQLKLPENQRDNINVNETAYSNPQSDMFLGHNMTKNEFIQLFSNRNLREEIYYNKIEYYKKNKKSWPGKNKSLADASLTGWRPGKLTQAGLGNTYSDLLGGFLSTFVASMIISASGQCVNSLISEVLGLVIGCLLGIIIPRLPFTPSSLT